MKKSSFIAISAIILFISMPCIVFINFAFCANHGGVIRQQEQIQRTEDEQRREAERRHREMQARPPREIEIERPDIPETPPDDGICVPVDSIRFTGDTLLTGSDKARLATPFTGRCLGMNEIGEVVRAVTNLYIERGYVTTRAAVPVQDLASRILEIRIVEGEVEGIRLNEDSPADRLRVAMAFPGVKAGRPLNLRDIESAASSWGVP